MGLPDVNDEEILSTELVKTNFEVSLKKLNEHLNPWERIRSYRFIFETPSISGGELSPSMKLRRHYIEENTSLGTR